MCWSLMWFNRWLCWRTRLNDQCFAVAAFLCGINITDIFSLNSVPELLRCAPVPAVPPLLTPPTPL